MNQTVTNQPSVRLAETEAPSEPNNQRGLFSGELRGRLENNLSTYTDRQVAAVTTVEDTVAAYVASFIASAIISAGTKVVGHFSKTGK